MLEGADYKKKLQETLEEIKDYFDFFDIRGSDVSCFIFAKKDNFAIEIYQGENSVIVEFWEDENLPPFEKEVNSYEKAGDLVIQRISKKI